MPVNLGLVWTSLALGLYLLFDPLLVQFGEDTVTLWVAEGAGIAVVLVALWAMARPVSLAARWVQAGIGVLLVIAPVVFAYTECTAAAWNAYVVGAMVIVLALLSTRFVLRGSIARQQGWLAQPCSMPSE